MKRYRHYINNSWVESSDGGWFTDVNPANGQKIAEFCAATREDVDRAVAAAKQAYDSGIWSDLDANVRAEYMLKAAKIMRRRQGELAQLEAMDTGKPVYETTNIDIPGSIDKMEYFANIAREVRGEVIPIPGGKFFDFTTYEPYGVVAVIPPWNFPLHLLTRGVCPALAAGNTVVLKASSLTPLTAVIMAEIFEEAGMPAGVVNIISGTGSVAGAALAAHPDVQVVAFTGSVEVGREILKLSAESPIIKKVTLELGGKSPIIVEPDCDFEGAVNSVASGFCYNQGQVCCATTRLFLHEGIYDKFLKVLVEKVNTIKMGDPLDPDTRMGALINEHQYHVVDGYVKEAVACGAQLLCGGSRYAEPPCDKGYYYRPTILAQVINDMKCAQEEIFGPVLVVMKYSDIREAVRLANDSPFGLGAGIWSENPRTLYWVTRKLNAGTVWMNVSAKSIVQGPYGGNKNSGFGRESGLVGLKEYMQLKNSIMYVGKKYANHYGFTYEDE